MFAVVVRGKIYVSNAMTDFLALAIINGAAAFYTSGLLAAERTVEYYASLEKPAPVEDSLIDWAQRVVDTQNWRLP